MPGKNLARSEAVQRAATLIVEAYTVALDLTNGPEGFDSVTTVRFDADIHTDNGETFIDLIADSVSSITLNGNDLDPDAHFDGVRVQLPDVTARNELRIAARCRYMNTGEGLHRFVDPADGEVYLYSQFEVADARRMFAVFDQPDLKATFAFTVTAPAHWQVISNQPTPQPVPAGELADHDGSTRDRATWNFEPTPRMSSYVTALIAGPYDVIHDDVETRKGLVPLALYCRRSLRPHLDAEEIFDCTKAGFAFFEEMFDSPYPFTKYDQIFAPEYNMGAMENAGAVTISEIYVFRARVTEALVERRALTILHELAHMWFGDLVTMRWWNDLWLNESFAEWASTTAQSEATRWTTAWSTFAVAEKTWAYRQDQYTSTHPIVADIGDLHDVETNFDGITYAKGASVLKQLVAYVGREPFVAGLRRYIQKYAWGNTTLDDLLGELAQTSGRDLATWSKLWLETAGVNTLTPHIQAAADGTISRLSIEQTAAADHPTIRPHRLAVGAYHLDRGRLVRTRRVELDIDGESTDVEELVGTPVPDLLLLNDDDLAYAKIRLDQASMRTVVEHPTAFTDSLPRALVLGAAIDMTRDGEMAPRSFLALALASLPGERDSTTLRVVLSALSLVATRYLAPATRSQALADLAAGLRDLAQSAEPGSDAQLQLVSAFARFARNAEDVATIRALLEGTITWPGLQMDTEMTWTLLTSLAAAGAADDAEIRAAHDRDKTATGRERAAKAMAARPTAQAKAQAWELAVEQDGLPNAMVAAYAAGFGRVHDAALLEPYTARYHEMLASMWSSRTFAIAEAVAAGFYPGPLASPDLLAATQTWLTENQTQPAGLRRLVAENRDNLEYALTAQRRDVEPA